MSGVAHCFPFPKGQDAPKDQPDKPGIKRVEFGGGDLVTLRNAEVTDLRSCSGVALRDASLVLTLPQKMNAPKLEFEGGTRMIEVSHLARHADLKAEVGQLVFKGQTLGRPFAQTLKVQVPPEDQLLEAQARVAQKELAGLDAEESAMRKSELWSQFASSFAQRRVALKKQASFKVPQPRADRALPPVLAPFSGVVESIEWEAPTVPTLPGEKAQHTVHVVLAEVTTR